MPILPTYSASKAELPISGGRRATAADFATGFDASGIGKVASSLLDQLEHEEARKALVQSSELRAKYARALDEASLSGGDLAKLKEQMQNEFAKIGENFQTKQGQETLALYAANTDLMYDEQANRINVQRASAQARIDGQQLLRNDSAVIQSNPLYLGEAEKNVDALVSTFTKIPTWQRAEISDTLKKNLNMAAATASARINPEAAKRDLEGGKWNLTSEQRNTAIDQADTEIRSRRAEAAYLKAEEERQRRENDELARDRHFKEIMTGSRGVRAAIMADPDLRASTREHLTMFMETRAKELAGQERKSNPAAMNAAWLHIANKEWLTSEPIAELVKNHSINLRDAAWLTSIVQAQRNESGESFRSRLGLRIQVARAALAARPDYSGLVATGTADQMLFLMISRAEKQAELLRKNNDSAGLEAMLDPDSKGYFFKPRMMVAIEEDAKRAQRAAQPQPVRVTTQAEYDALEPGTQYTDSEGKVGTKRGGRKVPSTTRGPTVTGVIGQ